MSYFKTKFHFSYCPADEDNAFGPIHLYQIGDLYSQPGYQCDSHIQTCHEITFVVGGSGLCTFNGKAFRVKEKDIFLSPLGSEHRIRSNNANPLRHYFCGFTFDREHPDYPRFAALERLFENLKHPLSVDKYALDTVFSLLFREISTDGPNRRILIETGLTQLLLLTQQCFEDKLFLTDNWTMIINHSKKQQLTHNVVQYIDDQFLHIKTLTEISDHFGYSYSYMAQAFSSTMGISLNDYYQEKRMHKAVELLKKGVSVTQVSNMLGFNMVQAFSRAFKKFFGMSPSQYIKENIF